MGNLVSPSQRYMYPLLPAVEYEHVLIRSVQKLPIKINHMLIPLIRSKSANIPHGLGFVPCIMIGP